LTIRDSTSQPFKSADFQRPTDPDKVGIGRSSRPQQAPGDLRPPPRR
jgi:hypothetical protein